MTDYQRYAPICGAKTRRGTACAQTVLFAGGRCKFHGGYSTGPRTPEGKARSALNGLVGPARAVGAPT